jgi:hypothetical protein
VGDYPNGLIDFSRVVGGLNLPHKECFPSEIMLINRRDYRYYAWFYWYFYCCLVVRFYVRVSLGRYARRRTKNK